MGQYWIPVNVTKREYINPHQLGCGLKLREQIGTHPGTAAALLALLAAEREPRGGGDFTEEALAFEIVGRWAGDYVAIVGDYAEDSDLPTCPIPASQLYERCGSAGDDNFRNITPAVCAFLESELGGKFKGEGWRSFVYDDETEAPTKLAPDMVLGVKK